MNQVIYNLMLINFTGTIFYICYIIYTKVKKQDNIKVLFNGTHDLYDQYNKIIKKQITVYIMGVLLGLMFLVICDTKNTTTKSENNGLDGIFVKD